MDLGTLKWVVDFLVALSGLIVWIVFIPQLKLLYTVKESKSNSIWTSALTFLLQFLILIQADLNKNWTLAFTSSVSVFFVGVTLIFILYYRKFPGGRT